MRAFIDGALREVEDFFYARIEAAKHDGTMKPETPSRETAQALLALFLGLRVLTRSGPNEAASAAIVAQAKKMLG